MIYQWEEFHLGTNNMFSKIKIYLIIFAVVGAGAFGLWKYYEYTQNQIRIYAENAAVAKQAAAVTQAALDKTNADLIEVRNQFNEVNNKFNQASQRVDNLERKLAESDINYLASKRPGLVENVVDNATANVLRCLEIVSGSPLTEDEINATKPSKINSECPDLANPNYRP